MVKAEYQYLDLGQPEPKRVDGRLYSYFNGAVVRRDEFHTFRVGLNYKFGG